jgi:hypothetical protein
MRGQPFEPLALALQTSSLLLEAGTQGPATQSEDEARQELRELLRWLRIEHLKQQETEWLQRAASDPAAAQRYRSLRDERLRLQQDPDSMV